MSHDIQPSEITPESTYRNRRFFMKTGVAAGAAVLTTGVYRYFNPVVQERAASEVQSSPAVNPVSNAHAIEQPNTLQEITHYNNYYEFSTNKSAVAKAAEHFVTSPWTVEVGGLVGKPRTFDLMDLLKIEHEERIYRFRCVEGWSMVIPWQGFRLKKLLDLVEPLGSAKFVAFESYYDKEQMPNAKYSGIDLPYVEGLRLDEALHPLTLIATGLYGQPMPNQNGAPIRLVVPWKYGFKSIKSIVKITLTDTMPETTWNKLAPDEYGFYSNVNPNVDHPRWSQATEQRIGELSRRPSLMFNGYAEEVAGLYNGMDLKVNF
ncbi:protein-methionine-sulfoxide reductase catalytic subunit MsrP [Hydromonas duriensis]|uniref:Protein-methionine-sulfoxide reductase catalytic subunit MsrP n=1 Tax=Hydromonas duriensis TaxID=1527608 RepID=A0A4R6YB46_9BURK|nr:protein-methionine-sulfoxide reductase catalytic subunit MsrP [Hydromonas duriensis]TDR32809.1 sulfoxide reductase catalytic subunit YedY [Hydromonas duriensis]